MAFTAGTGSLVFIDIVAHLILEGLGLIRYDYQDNLTSSSDSSDFDEYDYPQFGA